MFAQVQYTPRAQFGPKLEALFRRHGSPISAVVEDHVETPQLSPSIPANGAHYHAINSSFFKCKAGRNPYRRVDLSPAAYEPRAPQLRLQPRSNLTRQNPSIATAY